MRLSAQVAFTLLPILAVIVAAGCGGDGGTPAATRPEAPATKKQTPPTIQKNDAEAPAASVKPLPLAKFDEMVKEHKGKVVVVDFWFLGCIPCMEAMPHLVELQNKHGKDNLFIATMDVDEPTDNDVRKDAIAFLTEKKITLTNYVVDDKEDVDLWRNKMDLSAFPTTMVYDREGKLVEKFEGTKLKEVEKLVGDLVQKK
jgi:thiol-disulfide isomerase/thioredoxin